MLNLDALKLNWRCAAAAFGALAIGTISFSGSAAATPLQLFPFFMAPPAQWAPPPVQKMILSEAELADAIARDRAAGRTIAFANGCFDLLHVGHVRYLQGAAKEADVLIVGVNGDDSVRSIKGEGRPVTHERERAEIVSAIRAVAYVTIFHDSSPARLIAVLKPDVHCKGTDYTADTVPVTRNR